MTRADFEWDAENDRYICPEGHELKQLIRHSASLNSKRAMIHLLLQSSESQAHPVEILDYEYRS
ncbi:MULTISPECIES: hypothetical protein [Roseovarius]|jgi:hypothetical protein|uniref:hypothetical protein n=1 Tax=Roseovarius TaxID=74030 RepID=UPI000CDDC14D|nr:MULTISPECIES: hypothetical protein [Roseovarius]